MSSRIHKPTMRTQRVTGPGAGAEKYDLLTAMAVNGLAAGGARQATMMRLIALVTARYNWALDEVSIGQREMAALWSVDERTAKRETKRMIDAGLLAVKRPGVRGRVAAYRLCIDEIYRQTETGWTRVGPDYHARMDARTKAEVPPPPPSTVVRVDFTARAPRPESPGWAQVLERLEADQPQLYRAWFHQLTAAEPDVEGVLRISAPSRFVADYVSTHLMAPLTAAVRAGFGRALRCQVRPAGGL